MNTQRSRYSITYDDHFGHVCTCTQATTYDDEGYPEPINNFPMVSSFDDAMERPWLGQSRKPSSWIWAELRALRRHYVRGISVSHCQK